MSKSKSVLINVTERDILIGEPKRPRLCPIARAVRRHFPGLDVGVDNSWVRVALFRGVFETVLPHSAVRFIRDYDEGYPVEPLRFRILVPEYSLRPKRRTTQGG